MNVRTAAALVIGGWLAATATAAPPLSGLPTLTRAYDATLDARFEDAASELRACRGAPPEACEVVDLARRQWEILIDPADRSRDAAALAAIEQALERARLWTEREPRRAEAWFYQGAALGVRIQLRVLRGQHLAAARDGRAIKEALERSLALDPGFADADLALGLYEFYAGVAPRALRLLGRLLLLPGGDRARGLERLERASARSSLVAREADYQRHLVYLWYERRYEDGLGLLEQLVSRYPHNPLFGLEWGDGLETYLRRTEDSRDAYERIIERFDQSPTGLPRALRTRAVLGLATRLDGLAETDRALDLLSAVTSADAPDRWTTQAWLALGRAARRLGDSGRSEEAFRRAALRASSEAGSLVQEVRRARRERVDPIHARAYRLALQGWRVAQAGDLARGTEMIARALRDHPTDAAARSRLGDCLAKLGRDDAAHAAYEQVLSDTRAAPYLIARTALASALLFESRGDASAARARFEHARDAFGASRATRVHAVEGLARLASRERAR